MLKQITDGPLNKLRHKKLMPSNLIPSNVIKMEILYSMRFWCKIENFTLSTQIGLNMFRSS